MKPQAPPGAAECPGLVAGNCQLVPPLDMLCHVGKVAKRSNEGLDVAQRVGRQFAGVDRLDLGDDLFVALDHVGKPVQPHRSIVRGKRCPARLSECLIG